MAYDAQEARYSRATICRELDRIRYDDYNDEMLIVLMPGVDTFKEMRDLLHGMEGLTPADNAGSDGTDGPALIGEFDLEGKTYTAFFYRVVDCSSPEKQRSVFVAILGRPGELIAPAGDNLDEMFPKLEERAEQMTDPYLSFAVQNIADGWSLKAHPRFPELIGWLVTKGAGYHVTKTADGLKIQY